MFPYRVYDTAIPAPAHLLNQTAGAQRTGTGGKAEDCGKVGGQWVEY